MDALLDQNMAEQKVARVLAENGITADKLRSIADIMDVNNSIFKPSTKPEKLDITELSQLVMPSFEILRSKLGMKKTTYENI